ncbi:antifungal protein ginkbilobin-2-like [Tripterygium wilfordii]|uniref:Antifungal protein ginkbilobin-2-like n=1 Tax=Tripterygium wilfordii TaxID=458696 RepID=A0A7J7E1L3_TRIWF|nr:antifungal protein ginkbilobin-2-like [Tripterygium wilfordii]
MGFSPKIRVVVVLTVGLLGLLSSVTCAVAPKPDTTLSMDQCNLESYSEESEFGKNVNLVISNLVENTQNRPNYNYGNNSPNIDNFVCGHATCNPELKKSECKKCLSVASKMVHNLCANRIGGHVELVDCTIRYEKYPF